MGAPVEKMTPTVLRVLPPKLVSLGTLLKPEEAEAPILAPSVRQSVLQWMKEIDAADELKAVGLKPRNSCLLSGPPGCGKTTLAHHFSARLGLPLLILKMDRIRSQYVGSTGQNIAEVFETIEKSPDGQVLFFDEFDALATTRSSDTQAASKENNAIVASLLTRIENYKGIMLAATNRASDIDPAIWRRFGMHLEIALPGTNERFAILKQYLHPFELDEDTIHLLADSLEGAPPSLLRQLMEGVKRDMILAPRLNMESDAKSVFARLRESCRPHESYTTPAFWQSDDVINELANVPWPPQKAEVKK